MAKALRLNNAMGSFMCELTKSEADEMERRGTIKKTGRTVDRIVAPPAPSNSEETSGSLTKGDMEALAGVSKMTEQRRERRKGYPRRILPLALSKFRSP